MTTIVATSAVEGCPARWRSERPAYARTEFVSSALTKADPHDLYPNRYCHRHGVVDVAGPVLVTTLRAKGAHPTVAPAVIDVIG
jgi:hypothetical protein